MSLTARSIVTVAETEYYLKRTITGTSVEAAMEYFIDLCSGQIEEEVGRKFGAQDTTLYLDGTGLSVLKLPYPIVALYGDTDAEKLASLQYRTGATEDWEDLEDDMDNVHYDVVNPMEIRLLGDESFPAGYKNIRVRFYAGYDTVPLTIEKICLEMVAVMWKESGQGEEGRLGLASQSGISGGSSGSTSYIKMWEEVWKPQLQQFKVLQPNVGVINL